MSFYIKTVGRNRFQLWKENHSKLNIQHLEFLKAGYFYFLVKFINDTLVFVAGLHALLNG